jgi:hypothetical protein
VKFSRSAKDVTARPNTRVRIESMETTNEYLHALEGMSKTIGVSDLNASTKQLLEKKCMKMGSKHHYTDADGDYLGCSHYWRGAIITGDAHRRVCGDLKFVNVEAKRKLVIFAENEQLKRQRMVVQKKRTVTRNTKRLARSIDRDGSLCDTLYD